MVCSVSGGSIKSMVKCCSHIQYIWCLCLTLTVGQQGQLYSVLLAFSGKTRGQSVAWECQGQGTGSPRAPHSMATLPMNLRCPTPPSSPPILLRPGNHNTLALLLEHHINHTPTTPSLPPPLDYTRCFTQKDPPQHTRPSHDAFIHQAPLTLECLIPWSFRQFLY